MVAAAEALQPELLIPLHWLPECEAEEARYLEQNLPSGTKLLMLQPQ